MSNKEFVLIYYPDAKVSRYGQATVFFITPSCPWANPPGNILSEEEQWKRIADAINERIITRLSK